MDMSLISTVNLYTDSKYLADAMRKGMGTSA